MEILFVSAKKSAWKFDLAFLCLGGGGWCGDVGGGNFDIYSYCEQVQSISMFQLSYPLDLCKVVWGF